MKTLRPWCWLTAVCLLLPACRADRQKDNQQDRASEPAREPKQAPESQAVPEVPDAGSRPRLVSQDEIRSLEQEIAGIEEHNRTRTCPRPVLRGEPLPGRAADDILELFEAEGEIQACREAIEKNKQVLEEAFAWPKGHAPEGFPPRLNRTAKPQAEVAEDTASLEETCRPVIALIQRAARREDGCSPFLPGLRDKPSALVLAVRVARLAAVVARRAIAQGDVSQGFDLLLDTLMFCQDFSRGGTSLLETMVGTSAAMAPLAVMEQALNRSASLDPALLQRVKEELGRLIAGQPHPLVYLRGEKQAMDLMSIEQAEQDAADRPGLLQGKTFGVDAREDMALAMLAGHETWDELLAGCKPEQPPAACAEHLRAVSGRLRASDAGDRAAVRALLEVAVSEDKVESVRRQVIDILRSVAAPDFGRYLARDGQLRFLLAALRLQAAYRRLAEKRRACPGAKAFDRPPLSALRTDPYSGKPIRVEEQDPGRYVLQPPLPVGKRAGEQHDPAVFIDCPYR